MPGGELELSDSPLFVNIKSIDERNEDMKFIKKPSIDLYPGVRVDEHTDLEYNSDNVTQTVKDLVLHTVTIVSGDGYKSTLDTTIQLQPGDILIFEDEGRGYIKPLEGFVTVEEAIADLEVIKELR
jgi:hypothetical protein